MNILSVSEEAVNLVLSGVQRETLQITAAGVLPIGELEIR